MKKRKNLLVTSSSKPKKIKRKKFKKNKIQLPWKKIFITALGAVFFVMIIWGTKKILKSTILSPKFFITQVYFDSGSVKQYDDPYFYKKIEHFLSGKNYFSVKLDKKQFIDNLKTEYNFVDNCDFAINSGKVFVKIFFEPFDFIVINEKQKFGVKNGKIYFLSTGNTLAETGKKLYLPKYVPDLDALTGFFFATTYDQLNSAINLLEEKLNPKRIVFFVGAERILVETNDNKRIFFSFKKNIENQIKELGDLKKFFEKYDKLYEIDFSSTETGKVIVRF